MEGDCCAALNADQLCALVMSHSVMSHEGGQARERREGHTDKGKRQTHTFTSDFTMVACSTERSMSGVRRILGKKTH